MSREDKDPYCCLLEKMKAATEGFDRGSLTTYRSMRCAVAQLSREDALALIDSQIAALETQLGPHVGTAAAGRSETQSAKGPCKASGDL
jgi:hypothetical protein